MELDNQEAEPLSLADELGKAFDEQTQAVEAPVEGETPEQKQAREYARDEAGRFKAKEEEAALAKQTTPEQQAQAQAVTPPKTWKPIWYKDEYGPWDKLAEPFRNALKEQEQNAAQAITKHSTAAKAWDPIQEALKPYEQQLRLEGRTPQQFVGNLLQIYNGLQGEETGIDTLNWLIQQRYPGYDLLSLADWMHQKGYQAQTQKVEPWQQEIQQLKQQVQQLSQLPQQQKAELLSKQISDWSQDKPDFAAVRPYMAALAKQNPEASLDQLYEQARWAHPELRERILAEREDKRIKELTGKRQAAATSPRDGPVGNGAASTQQLMPLKEELAARLDGLL